MEAQELQRQLEAAIAFDPRSQWDTDVPCHRHEAARLAQEQGEMQRLVTDLSEGAIAERVFLAVGQTRLAAFLGILGVTE